MTSHVYAIMVVDMQEHITAALPCTNYSYIILVLHVCGGQYNGVRPDNSSDFLH